VPSWQPQNESAARDTEPVVPANHPTAARLKLESEWNLALSYLDAARYDDALPLLKKVFQSFPERSDFGQTLFHCQLTLKQTEAAAETLTILQETIPPGVWSLLPRLELSLAQGNRQQARLLLGEIEKLRPADPEALRRLGMCLWRLREWRALAELARQALARDENQPLAWLGLAEASLRLGQPAEAADASHRAIGLNYFLPQAHLVLARAWLSQGRWAEAREAIQTVLRLQPNHRAAEAYSRRTGLAKSGPGPSAAGAAGPTN
jgi:tetratricopeptide (TPR) repeat protein